METEQLAKVVNTSQFAKQFLFPLTYMYVWELECSYCIFSKVFVQRGYKKDHLYESLVLIRASS